MFERHGEHFDALKGAGCAHCRGTGYNGRIGIFELFVVDEEFADHIACGRSAREMRRLARKAGMRTLLDDAIDKVSKGLSSFDELRRTVPYRIIQEPPIHVG